MTYKRSIRTHRRSAVSVRSTNTSMSEMASTIYGKYPIGHKVSRTLLQIQNLMARLRTELENDLHAVLTDADFEKYQNLYCRRGEIPDVVTEDETDSEDDERPSLTISI